MYAVLEAYETVSLLTNATSIVNELCVLEAYETVSLLTRMLTRSGFSLCLRSLRNRKPAYRVSPCRGVFNIVLEAYETVSLLTHNEGERDALVRLRSLRNRKPAYLGQ